MANVKLIDDIYYGFHHVGPQLKVRQYYEDVDPFPCYNHPIDLVDEIADKVAESFPIDPIRGPRWGVMAYEALSRTNGWTTTDYNYYDGKDLDGSYKWYILIALLGKRTPIHPAMTRFVVAHEYGHGVEYVLEKQMYPEVDGKERGDKPLLHDYAKLRGMEYNEEPYGARTWHRGIGEIFADDFRLLVPKIELEHWPHPDIPRPEELPAIQIWWKGVAELYTHKKVEVETQNDQLLRTEEPLL